MGASLSNPLASGTNSRLFAQDISRYLLIQSDELWIFGLRLESAEAAQVNFNILITIILAFVSFTIRRYYTRNQKY